MMLHGSAPGPRPLEVAGLTRIRKAALPLLAACLALLFAATVARAVRETVFVTVKKVSLRKDRQSTPRPSRLRPTGTSSSCWPGSRAGRA